MIEISIPDYWNKFNLNLYLIDLMNEHPECFYDDVKITSVYGSFPCVWNGGRIVSGATDMHNIKETIKPFNERGVSIRHTFTNYAIDEKMVYDTLGNKILELSANGMNGVNVGNEIMLNYIKDNYPEFYILCSTTMALNSESDIDSFAKDYLVVPYYGINNDFEALSKIKNKQNIELLIGEECVDDCPLRVMHHRHCADVQRYDISTIDEPFNCVIRPGKNGKEFLFYQYIPKSKHYISIDAIRNTYVPMGFNKFKIAGRMNGKVNMIERYVHWLVKDEYKDTIRNELLLEVYRD